MNDVVFKPVKLPKKRPQVLCSSCQSSKFMRWDADSVDTDKPSHVFKDSQNGDYWLIRCDYFRMTVFSPDALMACDAWKAISREE